MNTVRLPGRGNNVLINPSGGGGGGGGVLFTTGGVVAGGVVLTGVTFAAVGKYLLTVSHPARIRRARQNASIQNFIRLTPTHQNVLSLSQNNISTSHRCKNATC